MEEELTVVSERSVENRREHQRFVEQFCDSVLVRGDSDDTVLRKRSSTYT